MNWRKNAMRHDVARGNLEKRNQSYERHQPTTPRNHLRMQRYDCARAQVQRTGTTWVPLLVDRIVWLGQMLTVRYQLAVNTGHLPQWHVFVRSLHLRPVGQALTAMNSLSNS
jgi:hypothetical protein